MLFGVLAWLAANEAGWPPQLRVPRVGLLYSVARVLAHRQINLQLAKIATLGERVDDTFLIDGPELQHNRAQIAVETELLQALA